MIINAYKTSQVSKKFGSFCKSVLWQGTSSPKLTFIVILVINKGSHDQAHETEENISKCEVCVSEKPSQNMYVAQHYHEILKHRDMGDFATPSHHSQNGCHPQRKLKTVSEQRWSQGLSDAHFQQWGRVILNHRPDLTFPKLGQTSEKSRRFLPQEWRPSLLLHHHNPI